MDFTTEWWGYSKSHGWVVLDRSVPCNAPGARSTLEFVRASDGNVYDEAREKWKQPLYSYAPNHLKQLTGEAAIAAAAELEAFKVQWPEMQARANRERSESAPRNAAPPVDSDAAQAADAAPEKTKSRKKKT